MKVRATKNGWLLESGWSSDKRCLDSVRGLETIRNLISVQHVSHAGMEKQTKPIVTLSIQYGVHTHHGSNNQYS